MCFINRVFDPVTIVFMYVNKLFVFILSMLDRDVHSNEIKEIPGLQECKQLRVL